MIENKECTTETQSVCLRCKRRSHLAQAKGATGWILNFGRCKCGDATVADVSDLVQDVRDCATADGDIENGVSEDLQEVTAGEISKEQLPECIDERFDVIETLGKGGMGTVYKVRDRETNSVFALKLLHQNLRSDPSVLKRFEQEARAAEELDHPNLVPTYAHGVTNDGEPYLLIEYVEGETLAQVLEREGALEEDRAISIFEQICAALSYAHESKIVHRDIKPANIILSKTSGGDEVARVVDFGIAKTLTEVDRSTRNLTQTGEVFGSPHYMSPEQCLGLMLDEKSDIYSLGCVIFEAMSGKPPFAGANPIQLVVKHINDKPVPYLPKFGASRKAIGLQSVALKCLNKEANFRFDSMEALGQALTEIKHGAKISFDHTLAIQSTKLERNLHQLALYLPLLLVSAVAVIAGTALLPNLLKLLDYRLCSTLMFGLYSLLCFIISFFCVAVARTCLVLAQTGKLSRKNAWSTLSLVCCSVMLMGTLPASLFVVSSRRWNSPAPFVLPIWDWLTIAGLIISFLSGLSVVVTCLYLILDRGPTKVGLAPCARKALLCVSCIVAMIAAFGQSPLGYVFGRMGYWFTTVPAQLTSGADLYLTEFARHLAPKDLTVVDDSAEVAYRERRYDEAAKFYQNYADLHRRKYPESDSWMRAIYRIGRIHQKRGEIKTAIGFYSKVIDSPSSGYWNLEATDQRVSCWMELHEPLLAIKDCDALISNLGADTDLFLKKAISQEELGDLKGARTTIKLVDDRFALTDPRIEVNLAYLAATEGDESLSKTEYRKALDMVADPSHWSDLAKVIAAIQLGEEGVAIEKFNKLKENWYFTRENIPEILFSYPPTLREKLMSFVEQHKLM
ncbi:protein kinase [Candidatus Obscuribacterales bacterium]|nr:protein kinase [Candidatus Obscuribacterales bacterium]